MSSAGSSPGRRFFRPGLPSRAGPNGSSPAWWSFASSRIRTQSARTSPGTAPEASPSSSCARARSPDGPAAAAVSSSWVLGLDREQVAHDAGVAQGVDDVGNQEAISPAVMRKNPGRPIEHRRALPVESEDRPRPVAERADPHGPARDRKARLVEILAHASLARWKPTSMTARRRLLATRSTMVATVASEIAIPNMSSMACGPSGLRSGRRRQA